MLNPANGKLIGKVPDMKEADVKLAIESANAAFQTWKLTTAKVRKFKKQKSVRFVHH